ncbi:flagellar motor switch phosphatase FliY [Lederbergia lenta]|uniref:Inhibitor of MCP methylation CheC / FliN fusion protein n=1 Tax=Lederbergia lenta TaxID=1467 RepID=A0A2X4ZIG4_LEDLE|nr:flagellar motor switch phosphatase FliY [Lederbergia lenta]MCM3110143.1 flagellar motor switch phosphatase FliY [Lederbergia lenta]MEC2324288.1 flagellar motor switch phosphatase FliY [Lederbergia lenta]SQI60224.1 inhibitor of MCP methylation CheC / FliN fusion protein [Lederbergia lenta]
MTGEMLSQDEIDALLNGNTTSDSSAENNDLNVEDYLSEMQQDALGEIGNISFGSSATALSALLNQKVEITTPTVSIIDYAKLEDEFPHPYVAIQVKYTEGFSGVNILVVKQSDAAIIADLMLGGDGKTPADLMDEIHLSAVQEAMNQMMGSAATSMSSVFNKKVDISPPSIELLNLTEGEGTETIPQQNLLAKVSFRLKIGDLIDSSIMQVLPVEFATSLVEELFAQTESNEPKATQASQSETAAPSPRIDEISEQKPKQQASELAKQKEAVEKETMPNVQTASFSEFSASSPSAPETKNLEMLLDIPLQVTVELGRTSRTVKEIIELGSGSIIELDKLAGEPVDILVNSRLIAQGEVVVIEENFGVRVTDIVSQSDRIKRLK